MATRAWRFWARFRGSFHTLASFRAHAAREWSTYVGAAVLLSGIWAVVFMSEDDVGALVRKATLAAPAIGAILLLLRQHRDAPPEPGGQP